jgi:ParB family chromosome partitioning protein
MKQETVTRLRDLKVSARDQLMLDPRIIKVEKNHNPRDFTLPENREHLDNLKMSIREQGTLQPLLVRYDVGTQSAILVDGECRLRANMELIHEGMEIPAVPTIQVQGGNEAERLMVALTANTGKPLSQWELGVSVRKLLAFGWTVEDVATKMGKSARYLNDAVQLSDTPQDVKRMLSEGSVTPALALSHARKSGDQAGVTLRKAVEEAKGKGKKKATKPQGVTRTQRILNAAAELADAVDKANEEIIFPLAIQRALKVYQKVAAHD